MLDERGVLRVGPEAGELACGWEGEGRMSEPAAIAAAQADIQWADHVAIFYPLWLGTMPALLKAFLEQVMRPGFALGESEGMVKTVFDASTGELLGAHMVGAEVTELIQGYVIARTLETTEAELVHTVFPHPTLSEMMHESVLDAYGRALHI